MAEKKYYWLKLQNDFFGSKRIKKLRKLGADFVIIYLKMQLLALKTNGVLEYTGIEDSFADELALDIDEDTDKVQLTISFLQASGLLEARENNEFFLPYVEKNTGSEGSSAQRMRDKRERDKMSQCDDTVSLCDNNVEHRYIEIEKEKDIEIDIDKEIELDKESSSVGEIRLHYSGVLALGEYANVFMTLDEVKDLRERFGASNYLKYLDKLSLYIKTTGKHYDNHHDTLMLWMNEDGVYDEG